MLMQSAKMPSLKDKIEAKVEVKEEKSSKQPSNNEPLELLIRRLYSIYEN